VNVDALRSPGVDALPIKIGPTTAMHLPLRDGPFLITSAGIYSVSVTLGPTSFDPAKAPAIAAAVAALVLTRVRGGPAANAATRRRPNGTLFTNRLANAGISENLSPRINLTFHGGRLGGPQGEVAQCVGS